MKTMRLREVVTFPSTYSHEVAELGMESRSDLTARILRYTIRETSIQYHNQPQDLTEKGNHSYQVSPLPSRVRSTHRHRIKALTFLIQSNTVS